MGTFQLGLSRLEDECEHTALVFELCNILMPILPQITPLMIGHVLNALDTVYQLLETKKVFSDWMYEPSRSQSGYFFLVKKQVLIQVEAIQVMEHCTNAFEEEKHELLYRCTSSQAEAFLIQVQLKLPCKKRLKSIFNLQMYTYMCSANIHWAAITSYHKWMFLRRTDEPATFTYSTVELQNDNPRPFMALLATSLAAEGRITIPPPNVVASLADDKMCVDGNDVHSSGRDQHKVEPQTDAGDSTISLTNGKIR